MTIPDLPPLVTTDDDDWAAFQTNDPDWNMRLAGREIRKYCSWHIYPNLVRTVRNIPVGSHGIMQLPSLMVTDVASVAIQSCDGTLTVLDTDRYNWFDYGVIQPIGWDWYGSYYGWDWSYLPVYQFGLATVTFSSGYEIAPEDVTAVAYELVTTTMEVSAGNVKDIQTPGFKLEVTQPYGATLNTDQRNRLSPYRLPTVR
jgi:hypothetical protein